MQSKPLWKSKTVVGAVVGLAVAVLGTYGVTVDDISAQTLTEAVTQADTQEKLVNLIVLSATTALTIYGRFKASTTLDVPTIKKSDEK